MDKEARDNLQGIAIVGMAGRFPGARDIEGFWRNVRDGVESITFFTEEDAVSAGIDPVVIKDPKYVRAGGILDSLEMFDASFFGFTPKEAGLMDPQQRLFLETAWEALAQAGYDPEQYEGKVGVFAGAGVNYYLLENLRGYDLLQSAEPFLTRILNEKDFLATRVSYKLNLTGPAMTIQTACSTSLVAVHQACRSLLNCECDMALAGGVRILLPQRKGYLYQEGMIFSPDGHCRAFDSEANGTVRGNGVAIVALKRVEDAVADGDFIHAVIKGSAINNDGAAKVGYTAPSIDGQAEVIAMAQAMAGVDPASISYIEAHGTGTRLGDPIEIAGLTQAFGANGGRKNYCAIGSVKTNIGHTDAAAGVAGLIKTALALTYKTLPPSLNFKNPNPEIDFVNSPFYVNTGLSDWPEGPTPRRAGVSSFGIGGTNAHVIIEEAPVRKISAASRPWNLLLLSAKSNSALNSATRNLTEHLKTHRELNLADVCYTLQVGRKAFEHRRVLVCQDLADAVDALDHMAGETLLTSVVKAEEKFVVFMFPGQGSQHANMALELYRTETGFREEVDRCCDFLTPHLGFDLRKILCPDAADVDLAESQLNRTEVTQPALFVIEYALAKLFIAWGVRPQAMIGHSIGELVAACLAGVFSLEDALWLVTMRGQLMGDMPSGAMLAVPLPRAKAELLLDEKLSLAAVNGHSLSVISGPIGPVESLQSQLTSQGMTCHRLRTSHAFHSVMMKPAADIFAKQVGQVKLSPPKIPYLSNVTGTWITAAEATDPAYWARHMRETVRFSDGVEELLKKQGRVYLEVGPGRTLTSLVGQHAGHSGRPAAITAMRNAEDKRSDIASLLTALGKLWLSGIAINWPSYYAAEQRRRVPLPTYPFERQRYWVEATKPRESSFHRSNPPEKEPDTSNWFYVPSWKQTALPVTRDAAMQSTRWLVFLDQCGVGSKIAARLRLQGHEVVGVQQGEKLGSLGKDLYTIHPTAGNEYEALFNQLRSVGKNPDRILHLWSVTADDAAPPTTLSSRKYQDLGLHSLISLVRGLGDQTRPLRIDVVSNQIQDVTGEERLCPEKATILGACKIIPVENSNITCSSIDLVLPPSGTPEDQKLAEMLLVELAATSSDTVVAYRGNRRWTQVLDPIRLERPGIVNPRVREKGVYLITGGLGGIGLALAEHLAKTAHARLILIGRSVFPPKDQWKQWLDTHDEDDPIASTIGKLVTFESAGSEILVFSADIASHDQMAKIVAQAKARWGRISGVIHCAGVPDYAGVIQRRSRDMTESVLAAKVTGTIVLKSLFQSEELDFLVLCSSLSSIRYRTKFGQVAYCAANEFLDAFAWYNSRRHETFTVAINWCDWQQVGMTVEARKRWARLQRIADDSPVLKDALSLPEALSPQEGIDVFCRILDNRFPRVAVSTQNLLQKIEDDKHSVLPGFMKGFEQAKVSGSNRFRRDMSSVYVAPQSETERILADVWRELLGFDQIGLHDNFFDLGGHSLLATQVISKVLERFQVGLPLRSFFDAPTVAGLAKLIETIGWAKKGHPFPIENKEQREQGEL